MGAAGSLGPPPRHHGYFSSLQLLVSSAGVITHFITTLLSRTQFLHTNTTSRFLKIDFLLFKHTFDYTHVLLIFFKHFTSTGKKEIEVFKVVLLLLFHDGHPRIPLFLFLLFHLALGGG